MKRPEAGLVINWKSFLTDWSWDLMKTELAQRVLPPPESSNWLGFAPAGADDIEKLERRLGVVLPPSYKAFLSISNGWSRTTPFINRIRPTHEVNWFRVENEHWVELYSEDGSDQPDEEYYVYGADGAPDHRAEHLASLLQISDVEDGVYLLNPKAVTPNGEWEAWFFANWVPGAVIAVGIAFGVSEEDQEIGDILLSTQIQLYDLQRAGTEIVLRGDKPHATPRLINHFNAFNQVKWRGAKVWPGLILSGEKLIDDQDYRDQLVKLQVEAIGGEMEGAGLYVSSADHKVDWIVIKAICDWADGNKKVKKRQRQRKAAKNAAEFLVESLKYAALKRV